MTPPLWKRSAAEALGAFAIVFFGCGAAALLNGQMWATFWVNAVFGSVVAVCIYALGPISAAHFNPAVTAGYVVSGHFPAREIPAYVAAQCAGALGATGLHSVLIREEARAVSFGATLPALNPFAAFGIEVLLGIALMGLILWLISDRRVPMHVPGAAIGLAVTVFGLAAGPFTGCSMNPARSLGPAIFDGGLALSSLWIYLVAPPLGAVVSALIYLRLGKKLRTDP